MSLTKDEASDLKSLHERVVECSNSALQAEMALSQAEQKLAEFMWHLEHDKSAEAGSQKGTGK